MAVPDVPLASSDPTWHLPFAGHGQTGSGPGYRGIASKPNGDRSYCTQRVKRSNRGWKNQCAPRLYLCCCNIVVTSLSVTGTSLIVAQSCYHVCAHEQARIQIEPPSPRHPAYKRPAA